MQSVKSNSAFKLLCVIMSALMMLTVIPFSATAVTGPEYITLGTYNSTPIRWEIVSNDSNGMTLISTAVMKKPIKFNATATSFADYATSDIFAALNTGSTSFYETSFNAYEKLKLEQFTTTYNYNNSGAVVAKQVANYVSLPSKADIPEAILKAKVPAFGSTNLTGHWLADGSVTGATDKMACMVTSAGVFGKVAVTNAVTFGCRPVIHLAANSAVALPTGTGYTFTDTAGNAVNYVPAIAGAQFKIKLDDNYNKSTVVVSVDGTDLTSVNGVYTMYPNMTSTSTITVTGVEANPADLTAFNSKKAEIAAANLNSELYTAETWSALQTALNADVSSFTELEQSQVDAAVAAITAAYDALAYKPADFTAFDTAFNKLENIIAKSDDYYMIDFDIDLDTNYDKITDDPAQVTHLNSLRGYYNKVKASSSAYRYDTIHSYNITKQADVNAATAIYNKLASYAKYKDANTADWKKACDSIDGLKADVYFGVTEAKAQKDAIVAEHNYLVDTVDVTHQDEVDASAERLWEVYNTVYKDSNIIPADYTKMDELLAKAEAYLEENYYKDDEMEGGTAAWDEFKTAYDEAKSLDRDTFCWKYRDQDMVDKYADTLEGKIKALDPFIRLTNWQKFIKSIKDFFADVKYYAEAAIAIMKTLNGLLGMLFRGEIDLYGLFEMIGVSQEFLDFLIKIGIKPVEEEPAPQPQPQPAA